MDPEAISLLSVIERLLGQLTQTDDRTLLDPEVKALHEKLLEAIDSIRSDRIAVSLLARSGWRDVQRMLMILNADLHKRTELALARQ